jgi:outer membrane biosynthesis protein TonB
MQKTVQAAAPPEPTAPVMPAEPGKKDAPVPKAEKTPASASASKSSKRASVPKPAPKEAHAPQDQKEQPVAVAPKPPDPETMPSRPQKGAQLSSAQNESPAAAVAAPAALPKNEREATTITVYTLPVVHDHVLGSCRGTLTIDRDGIAFVSEKAKDSFYFKYPDFSYTLDGDRLTIKAGSAAFRFKSATARDKAENRSQLSDFYQGISKLHEEPSPEKAARGR